VLAVFTHFLICASTLVAMLARIQVWSCVIPWLDYCVQFLVSLQVPELLWLILVLRFMTMLNWLSLWLICVIQWWIYKFSWCIMIQWFIKHLMCFRIQS
jgi:hypothetical protein